MHAQRTVLQVSHEAPLRDDVKGFIVPRMVGIDAVRQVIVTPNPGSAPPEIVYCLPCSFPDLMNSRK